MRIIFIRHAEPDYENNTITTKGFVEADILAQRTNKWPITKIYCSPLGRAINTANPTLKAMNLEAEILDFMQEFYYPIDSSLHPTGKKIAWDLTPDYISAHPNLLDKDKWYDEPIMRSGNIKELYLDVTSKFDRLISGYNADDKDINLIFFCHLGIMMVMTAHLLDISPVLLWQGFFVAPTSVNVLNSFRDENGAVKYRVDYTGSTLHLKEAGEPVSFYGAFTTIFQE